MLSQILCLGSSHLIVSAWVFRFGRYYSKYQQKHRNTPRESESNPEKCWRADFITKTKETKTKQESHFVLPAELSQLRNSVKFQLLFGIPWVSVVFLSYWKWRWWHQSAFNFTYFWATTAKLLLICFYRDCTNRKQVELNCFFLLRCFVSRNCCCDCCFGLVQFRFVSFNFHSIRLWMFRVECEEIMKVSRLLMFTFFFSFFLSGCKGWNAKWVCAYVCACLWMSECVSVGAVWMWGDGVIVKFQIDHLLLQI